MDAGIDSFSPFYPTQDPSPLDGAANTSVNWKLPHKHAYTLSPL